MDVHKLHDITTIQKLASSKKIILTKEVEKIRDVHNFFSREEDQLEKSETLLTRELHEVEELRFTKLEKEVQLSAQRDLLARIQEKKSKPKKM